MSLKSVQVLLWNPEKHLLAFR